MRSAVAIEADDPGSILYQHTVLCQTGLPYRDPGPECREWERTNGSIRLRVEAGAALDPETGDWVRLGLPFGAKPRLILAYLNREALIHGSPEIEVEASLTAFVKRLLRYDPNGAEIRLLKGQLARLSASLVRFGAAHEGGSLQVSAQVVTAFDLWLRKDDHQRVLWPGTVRLSLDYFDSLQRHAVPLDERAVAGLAHSALALDIYVWLAQRLHRIKSGRPAFISWAALQDQFGWHYSTTRKFRQVFRTTLRSVLAQYRGARLDLDGRGVSLHHSPPPVQGRLALVRGK